MASIEAVWGHLEYVFWTWKVTGHSSSESILKALRDVRERFPDEELPPQVRHKIECKWYDSLLDRLVDLEHNTSIA